MLDFCRLSRVMSGGLWVAGLWLAMLPGNRCCGDDKPVRPLRVLLITGGCCHDYDAQQDLLKQGLEARARIEVTAVQQGGRSTDTKIPLYENADWARGYDLVIHDECFAEVKDPQWTERILAPHRAGLPAVVIHCAMHCYRDGTKQWFDFCGVTSHGHGAHYPHEVLNCDAGHPIMKNFGAAWDNPAGELYAISAVGPKTRPLATAKNRENGHNEVCVWTGAFGDKQTRVLGTTLGHHNETVSHPVFLDLLIRGVLWACDKPEDQYLKPVEARKENIDLARGKPASASTEETAKGNLAAHAVDGQLKTRWCASGPRAGEWLQVDLGKPQSVVGCRLDWENSVATYQFKIEGSIDGKNWTTLVDESQATARAKRELRFGPTSTRYVRVVYLGCSTGSWASLFEMQVLGEELVTVTADVGPANEDPALLNDVKVPEGFEVTLFAAPPAVNYPVSVAAAPDGVVYVAVDKNGSLDRQPHRGAIFRLRDQDGDGKADEVKLFVADVDSPRGLVWDHDRLYVMHPPHLSAFIDKDGDGISDEQRVLVKNVAFGFKDRPADHTSNGVTLGIDGWLYLAIGDFGFLEAEGTDGRKLQLRGGGVLRVRPDGSNLEVYSRGTRNILEVALDPQLNGFARDNTNDGDGWDIRLHHFSGLDHHGYPSLFKHFRDEIVEPLADYGGGSGCGALYLQEPGFPPGYGDAAYTCDWGREWVYRHVMTPQGATFKADQHEFLRVPRVTDLDVDALSHLYVASWKGATFNYTGEKVGYLLRVSPKGYRPEPLPAYERLAEPELVEALKSNSHRRRLEAQRALLRRGVSETGIRALKQLAANPSQPLNVRIAALFTLAQGPNDKLSSAVEEFTEDATLRAWAIRALGDKVPTAPIISGLKASDPRTRLEVAGVLARENKPGNGVALVPLLDDADPVVAHAAFQGAVALRAVEPCLAVLDSSRASAQRRSAALRVLRNIHSETAVDGLLKRLKGERDLDRRKGLLTALCRLYFKEGEWKGTSWGTRPDTTGPYYQPERWAGTDRITPALKASLEQGASAETAHLLDEMARHKISLDDTLDRVLELAASDERLIPGAVAQLARSNRVPAAAEPLLVRVADAASTPADLRSHACAALLKTDATPEGFRAVLKALALLHKQVGTGREFSEVWQPVQNPTLLGRHIAVLQDSARAAEPGAVWASAGLLVLSENKGASPESRALAVKTLDELWGDSSRRAQLLEAVLAANQRSWEGKVRLAMTDSNPATAAMAKKIASQWKLSDQPSQGPKLETMKPEDVIAAVLKQKGDVGRGEAVFGKLNCTKCHTVKADEPQRGPFLPNVAKTYKRPQLAEAVLLPSKTIAQGFVTNVFLLEDGKTLTGFVTQESADEITMRDNEGRETKIPVARIEERGKQDISMMPEGLAKELTLDEFASLIDYLESLAK